MNEIQKLILEAVKVKGSVSPQAIHAHLHVYNGMEVSVDKARRELNKLVVIGYLTKQEGHGSARSSYSLKAKG